MNCGMAMDRVAAHSVAARGKSAAGRVAAKGKAVEDNSAVGKVAAGTD